MAMLLALKYSPRLSWRRSMLLGVRRDLAVEGAVGRNGCSSSRLSQALRQLQGLLVLVSSWLTSTSLPHIASPHERGTQ
eukprot:1692034-Amphidinium_carterae.1